MCFCDDVFHALCYHVSEGFEGVEPTDMVLRTVQAGEPDLTENQDCLLGGVPCKFCCSGYDWTMS